MVDATVEGVFRVVMHTSVTLWFRPGVTLVLRGLNVAEIASRIGG